MSAENGNGNGESRAESRTMPGRNGGTLTVGGRNGGRTPSKLRAAMRDALEDRLQIAQDIADDTTAKQSDRLHALDFLAKYGLGTTVTETDTEGNDAIRVIREPRSLVNGHG